MACACRITDYYLASCGGSTKTICTDSLCENDEYIIALADLKRATSRRSGAALVVVGSKVT